MFPLPAAGAVATTRRLTDRYVMLKYTENTPLYDERFVNYGYNKIQFIEQLKYYRKERRANGKSS